MPDYKGIEYLRNKLARKRSRVALRYKYYDMKYQTKDFGISTPPDLRMWMGVLGWCGRAVDALADSMMDEISKYLEENTEAEILDEMREIR